MRCSVSMVDASFARRARWRRRSRVPYSPPCTANSVAATVTHRVHPVDAEKKRDLLLHLLANDARQTLVFGRT